MVVKFRKGNGIYPYINTVFSTFGELLLAVSNEKLVIRAQTFPVKKFCLRGTQLGLRVVFPQQLSDGMRVVLS